ncbi:toxin [Dietzia sp. SLG510A3-30A2]|nr:toxin [Dietzia sp. SLG510A3-30A2]
MDTNRNLVPSVHALLDRGKLEGALARPMHTFGGHLLHSTLLERGGALLHGLCSAHAFQDGNKRTAWICTMIYLRAHGTSVGEIQPTTVADFVEEVAVGLWDVKGIAGWLVDWIE